MKFAIWDKQTTIYTPSGAKFLAEQWIAKHPIAENPNVTIICADGDYNGAFFATLSQLEETYGRYIDFSAYNTAEEKVEAINKHMEEEEKKSVMVASEPTAEERIAAALEYQVMSSLPDEDTTQEV